MAQLVGAKNMVSCCLISTLPCLSRVSCQPIWPHTPSCCNDQPDHINVWVCQTFLAQAESVAQLVGARSVGAADSALAGLRGGLGDVIEAIRMDALTLLADIEVSKSGSGVS